MSEPESIEISARDLMPGWLDELEKPGKAPDYSKFEEREEKPRGRGRGNRPPGRGGDFRGRGGGGGGRGGFGGGGGGRSGGGRDQKGGERKEGDRGQGRFPKGGRDGRGKGHGKFDKGRGKRGERGGGRGRDDRRSAPPRLEGVEVALMPDPAALESIAKYIRETCRAYPMWDIARTMLSARERYRIRFRKSEGSSADLVSCKLDDSLWLTREEAVSHAVRSDSLKKYYRIEEVEVDPPRGNYSVIAVHRKSGTVLGPPNHHEYRQKVARLHQERFRHVPFERFQRDIEMRREEEAVEAWKESRSKERHFVYLGGETVAEEKAEGPSAGISEAAAAAGPVAEDAAAEEAAPEESAPEESAAGDAAADEEPALAEDAAAEEAAPEESAPEESAAGDAAADEEPALAEDAAAEETAVEEPEAGSPDAEAAEGVESDAGSAESAEGDEADAVVLKTIDEVAKHFVEHHADEVFESVGEAVVPGSVPGRNLAQPLLNLLKNEVESRQRSPLSLIQVLCRGLERYGVKFFKENKKLFVAAARPRAIEADTPVAGSVKRILDYVAGHRGTTVMDMMVAMVPGFEPPKKGEDDSERKPSKEEMDFVSELRWLTSEGYLVEYSSGKVRLGGDRGPAGPKPDGGKGKASEGKPAKKKRARKRKGRGKAEGGGRKDEAGRMRLRRRWNRRVRMRRRKRRR